MAPVASTLRSEAGRAVDSIARQELELATGGMVRPSRAAAVAVVGVALLVGSWRLLVGEPVTGPPTLRTMVAYGLGVVGFGAALIGGAVAVGVWVTRRRRRRALAEIEAVEVAGASADVEGLVAVLERTAEPITRRSVGRALSGLAPPREVGPLLSLFDHPVVEVRRGAVRLLGASGDARSVEALAAAIRDVDGEVRRAALAGLREMRARGVPAEPRRRELVDAALAAMDSENLVSTILGDGDFELRRSALLALIEERRHTELLILTGLAVLSDDPRIRALVLEALDLRDAAQRVLVLLRSWRSEGALLAMAGEMTPEQRLVAADVEAAILGKRPMVTAAGA